MFNCIQVHAVVLSKLEYYPTFGHKNETVSTKVIGNVHGLVKLSSLVSRINAYIELLERALCIHRNVNIYNAI